MKKFLSILLIFVLLLSLCACGENSSGEVKSRDDGTAEISDSGTVNDIPDGEDNTDGKSSGTDPDDPVSSEPQQDICTVTLTDADATGLNLPADKICVVDASGMQILITFCGDARQVSLRSVGFDGMSEEISVWLGDVLLDAGNVKSGEQLGLRVYIPDVIPNVAICYCDAQGSHCYGIFQSGRDGSLMLIDLKAELGLSF